jgi:PPM family protein phosphatase
MKLHFETITGKGKRGNNEDYFFAPATANEILQNLFIVCDGVGGAAKGEVASRLVCESISSYFTNNYANENIDAAFILNAIHYAEQALDKHIVLHPTEKGMATTIVIAFFTEKGVYISHAGDSRAYWIRSGAIIHKTRDHSLVNDLVASGYITEDEALTHPRRNIITQALSGTAEKVKPEIAFLNDLKIGDIVMLCSDGVLEAFTDEQICKLLAEPVTLREKKELLAERCEELSKDNFTCLLIEVF